jgi:hypothetical protein
VFWVDVSSTTLAKTDFLSIADRMHTPAETVDQVLGVLANTIQPWLLVLDNADDLSFDYQQYIPSGNRGVLMTTWNKTCHKFSTLEPIMLDHLSYTDAKKLLFDTCGTPDELRQRLDSAATKVLNLLDCHTLAVIQAGSFIQNGFATLEKYPKEYNRHRETVMSYHDSQSQSRYGHVYATFESSAENLSRRGDQVSADALDLLALLSMFACAPFPSELFKAGWTGAKFAKADDLGNDMLQLSFDQVERLPRVLDCATEAWEAGRLRAACRLLESLSLLQLDTHSMEYSISTHPLVHAWAFDRMAALSDREGLWISAGCLMLSSAQYGLDIWQTQPRQLRPHLHHFINEVRVPAISSDPTTEHLINKILILCLQAMMNMRE